MKLTYIRTLFLVTSIAVIPAQASLMDNFIAKYMTKVFSDSHGEGLPPKVGELPEGIEYRENFMAKMNISSVEVNGITQFSGNNRGLGLVKKSNENEPAFDLILSKNNYSTLTSWKNGKKFINALKDYTKEHGCIPKIISTSHGWRSGGRPGEGHGLSGKSGFNGIYVDDSHGPEGIAKTGARTFRDDVDKEIRKGKIKFCGSCIAQFYACNVSTYFADSFAKMSGCQTVVATGQNSPFFQERDADGSYTSVENGSHYWKSAAGAWEERQTEEMTLNGERNASWYRSTPIKNSSNEVIDIVKENLGELYIAL